MVICFNARASLGLDDFDHDLPHFGHAVFFLDVTAARPIDSIGALSSSHQSEDWPINLI
jgi:hypothetical protein